MPHHTSVVLVMPYHTSVPLLHQLKVIKKKAFYDLAMSYEAGKTTLKFVLKQCTFYIFCSGVDVLLFLALYFYFMCFS